MALPDFLDLNDPTRNLAALDAAAQDAPAAVAPPLYPTPRRTLYRAWDGEPIGYSNDCDPLTAEPELSGVIVPDILEDNRLEGGQDWALPLVAGVGSWSAGASPLMSTLWALGAYMAPLPAAVLMVGLPYLRARRGQ